jgi:asparagine synthase (glutamine-hydrolysing)
MDEQPDPFPDWLNSTFADRNQLRARWEEVNRRDEPNGHWLRPEAHARLATAPWAWYFESTDPGVTRIPIEIRYPFLDLRLVDYLLAIPPIPWCVDKHLLRTAMRGVLPDPVRTRKKAPLAGDPVGAALSASGGEWLDRWEPVPALAHWVNRTAVPAVRTGQGWANSSIHLRPLCLNLWLKRFEESRCD